MKLLFALFLPLFLYSGTFKVASYNVQNLFDTVRDGSEYPEFLPHTSAQWNEKNYRIKQERIAQVLKDLNADIVALQEVENDAVVARLQQTLLNQGAPYPYRATAKKPHTSVRVAVLSRFPLLAQKEILTKNRAVLQVTANIHGKALILFVNHWKAKSGPESTRLPYAQALLQAIKKLPQGSEYLILGDLNSNYNEYQTFRRNQKQNDTRGQTGINHVLQTVVGNRLIDLEVLKKTHLRYVHYTPWQELPSHERFSHLFKGKKGTLDHILIPKTLYDGKSIEYIPKSFGVFKPDYLYRNKKIVSWKMAYGNTKKHLGVGYSDHLPVFALFGYE